MTRSIEPIGSLAVLREALAELREPIAVDTEFHAEYHYFVRLMLIQICDVDGRELVVDARAVGDLSPLGRALSGRHLILHAATSDLPLLARCAGLRPGRITDTQVLAGFAGMGYPRGLSELLQRVLGVDEGPPLGLSDWSRRPLSPEQLRYAIGDVRHLHTLAEQLQERAPDSRASEATAELVERALTPVDPERAWIEIPAVEVLDGRAREVLRRLAAWRERRAIEDDRPTYQVASNAVLVDVSRRRPESVEALQANRKMPRGVARKHGEALVRMVREAGAVSAAELPASVATSAESRAVERALEAWAAVVELRDGVAARLMMPRALRRRLVAARAAAAPISPLLGWRHPWGAHLGDFLDGRSALSLGVGEPCVKKRD